MKTNTTLLYAWIVRKMWPDKSGKPTQWTGVYAGQCAGEVLDFLKYRFDGKDKTFECKIIATGIKVDVSAPMSQVYMESAGYALSEEEYNKGFHENDVFGGQGYDQLHTPDCVFICNHVIYDFDDHCVDTSTYKECQQYFKEHPWESSEELYSRRSLINV